MFESIRNHVRIKQKTNFQVIRDPNFSQANPNTERNKKRTKQAEEPSANILQLLYSDSNKIILKKLPAVNFNHNTKQRKLTQVKEI